MLKNITVTNIDNVNIADKNNMQPRKKMKMIHEQLFEQYGIDPEKVFERTGLLKTLPREWIPEILTLNIKRCKTPKLHQNINMKDRVITVGFETEKHCKIFYGDSDNNTVGEFNMNMNKSINDYIESKKEDPKKYNRIIVTESSADELQVTIRY